LPLAATGIGVEHLEQIVEGMAKDPRISARVDLTKLRKARLVQDLRDKAAERSA
jgi:hypothetical protein